MVAVVPAFEDPMEDAGGFEGPARSEEEAEAQWHDAVAVGEAAVDEAARSLGPDDDHGPALRGIAGTSPRAACGGAEA